MRLRSTSISLLIVLGLLIPFGIHATSATDAEAGTQPTYQLSIEQSSEPACIDNVVGQFNSLKHHGEALGFHRAVSPDPTIDKHYQSIQRLPRGGSPYVVLSRNGNRFIGGPIGEDDPGNLVIVRFDSRDGDGERMRSNRLAKGYETDETPPPLEDRAVTTVFFDGNGWPDYRHAGGMQTYGDLLFVALDTEGPNAPTPGMVVLVDMTNPESPVLLKEFPMPHKAGAVAVAKHPTENRHVMIVEGPDDNDTLKIYFSNGYDLRDPSLDFHLVDEWTGSELVGGSWPTGTGAHQTINMIEDCRNGLFLLGARNDPGLPEFGDDLANVYKVEFENVNDLKMTQVANGHFYCVSAAGRICNFVAAAGFYTSPRGELILYASEHENEGPLGPWGRTIRMGEFRHRDTYRPGSEAWAPLPVADPAHGYYISEGGSVTLDGSYSYPPVAQPWVELYDDHHWDDRSIVIDYQDRDKDDWHNFNNLDGDWWDTELGFNDKTSSARWAAPVGCDIILYEDDNYGGSTRVLTGTGEVEEIADFDDIGFGDATSSAKFVGDTCDDRMTHQWDLDNDGVYETPGATAHFDGSAIDGPADVTVRLKVCGPFYGFCPTDHATVHVSNLTPTITGSLNSTSINEGETVMLSGAISDPGIADTFTVNVDWGDGQSDSLTLPAGSANYNLTHTYQDDITPGTPSDDYDVSVTVTDDDGGSDDLNLSVTVHNLPPNVGPIVAPIDPIQVGTQISASATFADPGVFDTHEAEWEWGDGTTSPAVIDGPNVSGDHLYAAPGLYTVTLTVIDKDGGSASTAYEYVVVYDPNGGFVTGSGEFDSPPGAYAADPNVTGVARFNFVSKYRKEATESNGNFQFRVDDANLRFEADGYDWMVVNGNRALIEGRGTLNGAGEYGFLLSLIDGGTGPQSGDDLIRVKVWEINPDGADGALVYDSQIGGDTSHTAAPQIAIDKGQIVVHE